MDFFFAQQPSTDLLFILIETGKFVYSDYENFSRIRSHLVLLDSNINSKRTRWLYVTYTICDMKWGKLNQKEIKLKGDFVFRIFLQSTSTFFIRVSVEKSIQRIFLKSELPINHIFLIKNVPTIKFNKYSNPKQDFHRIQAFDYISDFYSRLYSSSNYTTAKDSSQIQLDKLKSLRTEKKHKNPSSP